MTSKEHQQNVIVSLAASGSVRELFDHNPRVAKSQSPLERCSGLQVYLTELTTTQQGLGCPVTHREAPESTDIKL